MVARSVELQSGEYSTPSRVPLHSFLWQVIYTFVPSSSSVFGTGVRAMIPCGWEGNRGLAESSDSLVTFR